MSILIISWANSIYFAYKGSYISVNTARLKSRWPKRSFAISISHNAPLRTKMCTFLFWTAHCGMRNKWDWSIDEFANAIRGSVIQKLVYIETCGHQSICNLPGQCIHFGNVQFECLFKLTNTYLDFYKKGRGYRVRQPPIHIKSSISISINLVNQARELMIIKYIAESQPRKLETLSTEGMTSLWNLTIDSAAVLPTRLLNFKAIQAF